MNLLITPAWQPTEAEKKKLEENHRLFFINDGRVPLSELDIDFNPEDIEGIICNFFFMYNNPDIFPNLKHVQLTSVGFDRVPVETFKQRNIPLYNAGSVYAIPMAEWALGKILEIYKQSKFYYANQEECKWEKCRTIKELAGSKAVIVGFGNVGKRIAARLKAFEITIHAVDIFEDHSGLSDNWSHVDDLKNVVSDADIVILALPLTEDTYHIINKEMLMAINTEAILINVARGALIDEDALINALRNNQIYALAADTFESEPLDENSPLWKMQNVYITPHSSFIGNHNKKRLSKLILDNLQKYI